MLFCNFNSENGEFGGKNADFTGVKLLIVKIAKSVIKFAEN